MTITHNQMDFINQVNHVKTNIQHWQDSGWGNKFKYLINEFAYEDENTGMEYGVFITKVEHRNILKYIDSQGYIKITDEQPDSIQIEVLPKIRPIIKPKALELIAIDIGEMDTGPSLVDYLVECGVDKRLILYPNTKWRMIYAVMLMLATSQNQQDKQVLFKVIEEATHPLMHRGDEKVAKNFESKFNGLLKYDNLTINNGKLKNIDQQVGQKDNEEYEEDDVFSYDGGLSSGYENTDLELFILKKILLEHKRRDDAGFFAKELSFKNNSLEEICKVINKLMEDKILYLSANTRPEKLENEEGIEDKNGFINWKMVKKLDEKTQVMSKENGCVIFDTDVIDEVKLKGRLDIAVEEFMNDKIYTPLGYLIDKTEAEKMLASVEHETDREKNSAVEFTLKPKQISYPYHKQREIIIDEMTKDSREELLIPLNNFHDEKVDVLKTLLALEKENLLRITGLEGNSMYDQKGNFTGQWSEKDNPIARIYTLKTKTNRQEPILMKIIEMPEIKGNFNIDGLQTRSIKKSKGLKTVEMYLNHVGDFWREPRDKYCYPMGENSDRHKIVRYLVEHNGYQQTKAISNALDGKSPQSIRTEIGKIRKNIKTFLKKDGKHVIDSKTGSGYSIGVKYRIKLKEL